MGLKGIVLGVAAATAIGCVAGVAIDNNVKLKDENKQLVVQVENAKEDKALQDAIISNLTADKESLEAQIKEFGEASAEVGAFTIKWNYGFTDIGLTYSNSNFDITDGTISFLGNSYTKNYGLKLSGKDFVNIYGAESVSVTSFGKGTSYTLTNTNLGVHEVRIISEEPVLIDPVPTINFAFNGGELDINSLDYDTLYGYTCMVQEVFDDNGAVTGITLNINILQEEV